jgi:hypothetical protein
MQSCGFEPQRLTAPARKPFAKQQVLLAAPHHHYHQHKQRDHTASGNELLLCVWRKPIPNKTLTSPASTKSKKLTAQKTSSAERRNGAKSSISSSSPQRHRKQSARAFFGQEQKKPGLASSIVFMSSPAHVSVNKRTSCRRDACWNNETLSGKKEEYFLENQGAVGSCEIVGDQYFEERCAHRRGQQERSRRKRQNAEKAKSRLMAGRTPSARRVLGGTDEGSGPVEDNN